MPTLNPEFLKTASLEARGISHSYGRNTVLHEINLKLRSGEVTALIGPNGAGKSTLLQIMQGMLTPSAGTVLIGEDSIQSCRQQIALMPQRGRIDWSFPITALEMVRLRQPRRQLNSHCMSAQEALERVGLGHRAKDRLGMLSGGQQQRLCIARTIATQPDVILMDEPCSALDPISTLKVEETMHELKKEFTIVIVTHSMQQAARVSQRTAFFHLGKMVEYGPTDEIFTNPLEERTKDYITGRYG